MLGQSAITALIIDGDRRITSQICHLISAAYAVAIIDKKQRIRDYLPEAGLVICAESSQTRLYEWLYHIRKHYNDIPIVVVTADLTLERLQSLLSYRISRCFDYRDISASALNKSLHLLVLEAVTACQLREDHLLTEAKNEELQAQIDEVSHDLIAGRYMQQKLLPKSPCAISTLLFEHQVMPSMYMTGDFVDYMPVNDEGNQCLFCIADVAGHGPASAMLTVLIKSTVLHFKSQFSDDGDANAEAIEDFMATLNADVIALGLDRHVTMVFGLIDQAHQQLIYCIAGHLPEPILSMEGKVSFLPGGQQPLGLYTEARYSAQSLALQGNWSLSLFTDGVFELMSDAGIAKRQQHLLDLVTDTRANMTSLAGQLHLQQAGHLRDDVTLLGISHFT